MSSMLLCWKRLVSRSKFYRFLLGATPAVESDAQSSLSVDDLKVKERVETWELLPSGDVGKWDDGGSHQLEWKLRRKPRVMNLRLSAFDLLLPQESTNVLFRNILAYHQANSSLARALLAQLIVHGFIPDFFTLTLLIESFCKDHKYRHAADAVSAQLKGFDDKDHINNFYTALICGLYKSIGPDSSYRLLKKLIARHLNLPFYYYSALMDDVCMKKMMNGTKSAPIVKEEEKDEIFATFLEEFCNDNSGEDLSKAISALRSQMLADSMKMNTCRLRIFLSCLCKYGLLEDAVNMFTEYRQMGTFKLDKVAYSTAMGCYCKIGNMDEAIKLLEEMKAKRMDPDCVDYTALVEGYQRLGRLDDMKRMAAEMEKLG